LIFWEFCGLCEETGKWEEVYKNRITGNLLKTLFSLAKPSNKSQYKKTAKFSEKSQNNPQKFALSTPLKYGQFQQLTKIKGQNDRLLPFLNGD
jgi:hypothetical protein